jgi:hypothetical protein
VRRMLAPFVMVLMALILFAGPFTPAASASVIIPCAMASEVAASGHTAGDADEVPSDRDQGTPHHHGVGHGHDVGVAPPAFFAMMLLSLLETTSRWEAPTPSSVAPTSDLRPPIA